MARGIAGLVVFIATFVSGMPAAAQTTPSTPIAEWAQISTPGAVAELLILARLDTFSSDPTVDAVLQWGDLADLGRTPLLHELEFVDADNAALLGLLAPPAKRNLSPAVSLVLGPLPADVVARIDAAETGFLDPQPWLNSAVDLIVRQGLPPSQRDSAEFNVISEVLEQLDRTGSVDLSAWTDLSTAAGPLGSELGPRNLPPIPRADAVSETDVVQPLVTPAASQDTPPASPDGLDIPAASPDAQAEAATASLLAAGSDDGEFPLVPIAAGGAAVLVIVAIGAVIRRQTRRTRQPEAHGVMTTTVGLADVLETTLRMTSALDAIEIQTIAVSESVRLTQAEAGAFVVARADGARYSVRSIPELFADTAITEGALARVMEAGQAVQLVSHDEPSLARLPAALAAVPVIAGGGVTGAIVVIRPATKPFTGESIAALELLAPITGSALAAAALHRTAVTAADVDGLTNLHNRRRLDHDLAALGETQAVCFAMIDIDYFKQFNDAYGHAAGDEALRLVASAITDSVRAEDTAYRYGGEEFSVLLRHCTDAEAKHVMERVRGAVEGIDLKELTGDSTSSITISVGLATAGDGPLTKLTKSADQALYAAKDLGRNQVVVAD